MKERDIEGRVEGGREGGEGKEKGWEREGEGKEKKERGTHRERGREGGRIKTCS